MKKIRKEHGITLIALIITIVVLLILAVVTINSITGDGDLIAYANNAGTKYTAEEANENKIVDNYLIKINKYAGSETTTKAQDSYEWGHLATSYGCVWYQGNATELVLDEQLLGNIIAEKYILDEEENPISTGTSENLNLLAKDDNNNYIFDGEGLFVIGNPLTGDAPVECVTYTQVAIDFLKQCRGESTVKFANDVKSIPKKFIKSETTIILTNSISTIEDGAFSNKSDVTVRVQGLTETEAKTKWGENWANGAGTVIYE